MEFTNMIVPEVLSMFECYNLEGNKLIGVTGEVSLAELTSKVTPVEGAGIIGSYEVPILGHYDPIDQVIPFRVLYEPTLAFADPSKTVGLNLRGAIQVTDKSTGTIDWAGLRYMVRGRSKVLTPGTVKTGDVMGASISIAATYVMYEIDGKKLIELDKLNGVFKINGVDLIEKARKLC